jgi:hypothetical protein
MNKIKKIPFPIGQIIQEEAFNKNIALRDLCDLLNVKEKEILFFFENSNNVDVNTLFKFSEILKVDFFSCFSNYLHENKFLSENFEINDIFFVNKIN